MQRFEEGGWYGCAAMDAVRRRGVPLCRPGERYRRMDSTCSKEVARYAHVRQVRVLAVVLPAFVDEF